MVSKWLKGIPRHDYEIADANGNVVGISKLLELSPSMGIAIGMGYVQQLYFTNSEIYIRIRNKDIKAKWLKCHFTRNSQNKDKFKNNENLKIELEFELEF